MRYQNNGKTFNCMVQRIQSTSKQLIIKATSYSRLKIKLEFTGIIDRMIDQNK